MSFAHTTQWMGLSGVLRSVQTGNVFGVLLGWHSKHSVRPLTCTLTCTEGGHRREFHGVGRDTPPESPSALLTWPKYPAVPDSTRGTPAARHRRLMCRRASRLSRPLSTQSKRRKKSTPKRDSFTFAWTP